MSMKLAYIGATFAVLTGVSSIVGGWVYVDDRWELREAAQEARSELEQQIAAVDMGSEQAQIQLRLDIIEDRVEREQEKPVPRNNRLWKWQKQMQRLEQRYELLDEKQLEAR